MRRITMFAQRVRSMLVKELVLSASTLILVVTPAQAFAYTFTTIDVPGATGTEACGINPAGQIVGGYTDASGMLHGFVAAP